MFLYIFFYLFQISHSPFYNAIIISFIFLLYIFVGYNPRNYENKIPFKQILFFSLKVINYSIILEFTSFPIYSLNTI